MCMVVCNFLNASHFFLLGRPGPAALLVVTGVRYSAAVVTTDRRVMFLFLLGTAGIFFATATNALSVMACIGTLIATYGSFHPNSRSLRLITMVGNSIWLVHNVLASTPVGAVMEAAFLTSNMVGYWRYHMNGGTESRAAEEA